VTKTAFKKEALRVFRSANPGAKLTVTWTYGPVPVVWADGTQGMSGTFDAAAAGYRTRRMHAALMDGRVTVR
jgi:hypothetical protein